jgi:hypothetical protein
MRSSVPAVSGAPPKSHLRLLLILLVGAAGIAALSLWPMSPPETISPLKGGDRPPVARGGALDPESVPELRLAAGRGAVNDAVGRDVFRFYSSPTPTPTKVPPTPTPTVEYTFPSLPTPVPTPTPIVPPPFPFKAIGKFGPKDRPIVALEEGARLINAQEGDVVDNRFIVRKINRESVDFGFVGLPPEITRRLPIPLPYP